MTGNKESEKALKATLTAAEAVLGPLRSQRSMARWRATVSGTDRNRSLWVDAEKKYRYGLNDRSLFDELTQRLQDAGVQDIQLRRWANLMRLEMAPCLLEKKVIDDLVKREHKLITLVHAFRPTLDGKESTMNRVAQILRSNDSTVEERREAWEAGKEIGPKLTEGIRELVRARNLAARSNGFPDFYRMMLEIQEIDEARLFSQLGQFASVSEDPFRRMKAQLDRLLADKYHIDAIDLEAWHYSDPFFQEAPPAYGVDVDHIYQGHPTMDWLKSYYKGIGLNLDKVIKKSDLLERKTKAFGTLMEHIDQEGDVRVSLNLQDSVYWAAHALHEFGRASYESFLDKKLPQSLRRPAHPSTSEGIGMMFARLIRDIEWMIEMFNLTGPQIREFEKPLQQEQRLQMALFGRWSLVMIHFERGLYRDPDQDQQQRWWDLVERFQLLRRPSHRTDQADWASKMELITEPVYYQNYLLGQWQASQIAGAMVRDLNLEEPVVWAKEKAVGKWLKDNLFKVGAQWEFNELMRNLTGNPVRPDEFLDDFFS